MTENIEIQKVNEQQKITMFHDDEIVACKLEAVINKNQYQIDWQNLKDSNNWLMGWK